MTDTNGNGHLPQRMTHWKAMPDIPPSDRDAAKEILRPGLERWCRNVLEGLEKGNRTSMHLFAKAMDLVGADVELNINLLMTRELGVTLLEARRKLAMVDSVEGIGEDEAVTAMEVRVREWYAARGKRLVVMDEPQEVVG